MIELRLEVVEAESSLVAGFWWSFGKSFLINWEGMIGPPVGGVNHGSFPDRAEACRNHLFIYFPPYNPSIHPYNGSEPGPQYPPKAPEAASGTPNSQAYSAIPCA